MAISAVMSVVVELAMMIVMIGSYNDGDVGDSLSDVFGCVMVMLGTV